MKKPQKMAIKTYQVGFGDCYLLTFFYKHMKRHILIDFGSSGVPKKLGSTTDHLLEVAKSIKAECNGKLHAVVATHRHSDHIAGFGKRGSKDVGAVIADCKPNLVVQPWTEHPRAAKGATAAPVFSVQDRAFAGRLSVMQNIAANVLKQNERLQALEAVSGANAAGINFIGQLNIRNKTAVKRLMQMGRRHAYVHYGSRSGFEKLLPGVTVTVLGPPTLKQTNAIRKQRSSDPGEFWQLQHNALRLAAKDGRTLFPQCEQYNTGGYPLTSRWIVERARKRYSEQLLGIVRILDRQMNNTSVILLFEVGEHKLLFSGDAQIENWSYALAGPDKEANQKLLKGVTFYKVGHHGSRNATPKTLWNLFGNKNKDDNAAGRLGTLLSTMKGKHGHWQKKTEVPRKTLVRALETESNLIRTDKFRKSELFKEEILVL